MEKIINRLDRIENILSQKNSCLFPSDIDHFIESLGVTLKKYEVNVSGTIGYDFLQALEETAVSDWS